MPGSTKILNFGRNVSFEPERVYRPKSTDEVLEILGKHRHQKIRAVGSLHAWSDSVKTTGIVIELADIHSMQIDVAQSKVTVGGGCKIKHLLAELAKSDLTLPSVGLIDEQTIAGATATATHGSGKHSLSHYIDAVEIAHFDEATGEPVVSRIDSGIELQAARCSLGLLGVVVSLTIRCCPCYNVEEHAAAFDSLEEVVAVESTYPQQQFYLMPWSWSYFGHHRVQSERARSRLASLYRVYNFLVIDIGLHVAVYALAKLLKFGWATKFFFKRILPLTIIRNWKVVDDSHAMLTMEHELFRHIEIELFVQRSNLKAATQFLIDTLQFTAGSKPEGTAEIQKQFNQMDTAGDVESLHGCYVHHYPICYRRIKNDEVLVSMASESAESQEDWYAISLISYQWPSDRDGFFKFAEFIAHAFVDMFGGRCHWGKYNPLAKPQNEQLYPQLNNFRSVVKRFDNGGHFTNEWLNHVL